jgi:uncharacterized protein (TIGR03000 family)
MCSCVLSLRLPSLAWAALLLSANLVWSQSAGYPYPYSGYPYPLSGNSSPAPYWGSVPSYYGGAPLPYHGSGLSSNPVANYLSSPQMFAPNYLGTATSTASTLSNAGILWPSRKPRPDDRAHIWLRVPDDAEVWFDDAKTKQTGPLRYFFSPPLAAGKSYSYQVQVRWKKDGKPVERKQRIDVHAGQALRLDLTNGFQSQASRLSGESRPR